MKEDSPAPLRLKLPAILCRIWTQQDPAARREMDQRLAARVAAPSGILSLRPDLFAVIPTAGDCRLVEVAFNWCRRLLEAARVLARTQEPAACALLFPGQVRLGPLGVEVSPSSVLEDLEKVPPKLAAGQVYLTSHAAHGLETRWLLLPGGEYRGRSGLVYPLRTVAGISYERPPWRNVALLGRRPSPVPRPAVIRSLLERSNEAAVRVSGPLGCGKSRAVWDVLDGHSGRALWARSWSARSGGPSMAFRFLHQLLLPSPTLRVPFKPELLQRVGLEIGAKAAAESWWGGEDDGSQEGLADSFIGLLELWGREEKEKLRLICDDLENLEPNDRELLDRLLQHPLLGKGFQLVLIARTGAAWPATTHDLPTVEIPPFEENDLQSYAQQLLEGLSLPPEVAKDFLQAVVGCPFALEEGLIQLIRRKQLRQLYGNFFYSGTSQITYEPSARFAAHAEAEVQRLGAPTPLRILALAETPVPAPEAAAAATVLGENQQRGWERPYLAAGLLRQIDSPWGHGLTFAGRAFAESIAGTVADESVQGARHALGELLAHAGGSGSASWHAYALLAGTAEAIPPLLAAAEKAGDEIDRQELFDALCEELDGHRARGGDAETELQLLWELLPLARRMGVLRSLGDALARGLKLAESNPERLLALTTLKAEHDQNEGRFRDAEAGYKRALALAQDSDERRKALLVINLGRLLIREERYPEARKLFEGILPILDRSDAKALAATCSFFLGEIAFQENRIEDALKYHQKALEARRRLKLVVPLAASHSALGAIYLSLGNYPAALDSYRESQTTLEETGKEAEASTALIGVGCALSRLGDFTAASQPLRRALALRKGKDDVAAEAIARLAVAENHLQLGQVGLALEGAREAHFRLTLLDSSAEPVGDSEQLLGRISLHQRRYKEAQEHFENALAHHREQGDAVAAAFDQAWLLETAQALQDADEMRRLCLELEAALESLPYPESGESLDLRLFRAWEWLAAEGQGDREPLPYLRRAYSDLLRKTQFLAPEMRNRFLLQIPDHRAILDGATRQDLSIPAAAREPS